MVCVWGGGGGGVLRHLRARRIDSCRCSLQYKIHHYKYRILSENTKFNPK